MSAAFEGEILKIDTDVSIDPSVREAYTKDFHIICKHVLDAMSAESPLFRRMHGGTSLFGSYLENLKIDKPDEFDVHVLLNASCQHQYDKSRPGFVYLNVQGIKKRDPNPFEGITETCEYFNGRLFISRFELQNWMKDILEKVFERTFNQSVRSCTGTNYKLTYNKCATAHNIEAKSKDRTINIDLVPAFRLRDTPRIISRKVNLNQIPNAQCFAVPKAMDGDVITRGLSFSVCAPQIEKFLLIDMGNLKRCLRLMKSLRDKIGKPAYGLKSYLLKTLFLYEVKKRDTKFWHQPVGTLLLHMLGVLLTYLNKENIPFYWDRRQNLLRLMDSSDIQLLKQSFSLVFYKLRSFSKSQVISSSEIRALFDI